MTANFLLYKIMKSIYIYVKFFINIIDANCRGESLKVTKIIVHLTIIFVHKTGKFMSLFLLLESLLNLIN